MRPINTTQPRFVLISGTETAQAATDTVNASYTAGHKDATFLVSY